MSFWNGRSCNKYIGIDISPYIVKKNRELRPNWEFFESPAQIYIPNIKGQIVLCLDVLIHILNDANYLAILHNLILYAEKWIVLHTWSKNPFLSWKYRYNCLKTKQIKELIKSIFHRTIADSYQSYRNFMKYVPLFEKNHFSLIEAGQNKFNPFGAIFVFRKQP